MNPQPDDRPTSILVVEDDPAMASFVARCLRREGLDVSTASSADEAMGMLDDHSFALVLCDVQMPGMLALDLVSHVSSGSDTGVIMMTAVDDPAFASAAMALGAIGYLTKPFTANELAIAVRVGLQQMAKEAKTKLEALTDGLTGAWNHRYLTMKLAQELTRSDRFGRVLSVLAVDLDHFKSVNDTHGHGAGDQVLKICVDRMNQEVRSGVDVVARYGGEEFIVILPETDLEAARLIAERIRKRIRKQPFMTEAASITVTASIGVAAFPTHGRSSEALLERADAALYLAKRSGRDAVMLPAETVDGAEEEEAADA